MNLRHDMIVIIYADNINWNLRVICQLVEEIWRHWWH